MAAPEYDYTILEFDISQVSEEELVEFHKELVEAVEETKKQMLESIDRCNRDLRKRSTLRDFASKHLPLLFILPILLLGTHG